MNINLPAILIKQKYYYDNKKIRIELNKAQIRKNELDEKITECLNQLEKDNPQYPRKCADLENEIKLLGAKLRNHNWEHPEPQSFQDKINEAKKPTIDSEKEKKCKEIYKEISKKTHPDVAKDEELIPLFSEAKNAMEQGDLLELQRIKEQIESGNINLREKLDNIDPQKLKREYELLVNELKKERSEYEKMLSSVQFRIYNLSTSEDDIDNMVGNKIFLDLILSKIMQMKGHRDNLKTQAKEKGIN
ncbi:MAG: hypothetical protein H8D97_01775 [Proteobacteria bacterium]|nr:hypothetical protein [Pseudomonadota bacterium]